MFLDNINFTMVISAQTVSIEASKSECESDTLVGANLVEFASYAQLLNFVDIAKSDVLPDLFETTLNWEFWTNHRTNVAVENSVTFSQLTPSGNFFIRY